MKPALVTTLSFGGPVEAAPVVVGARGGGEHEQLASSARQISLEQRARRGAPLMLAEADAAASGAYHQQPMALLIASDLHKDIAGQPLLRGVSFKLERRERLTIAGRNGAGKTTLLRMLAGETSIDRGELSVAKGARIALHDQRPPRERALRAARVRALGLRGGARDRGRAAPSWRRAMAAGDGATRRLLARYAARRRAWRRAAATCGATARPRWRAAWGSREEDLDRAAGHASPAASSRAPRSRARWPRAPTCCCSTSPPTISTSSRWSGSSRRWSELDAAVVLVAHDRWFLEAVGTAVLELEARALALLRRQLAPVAPRAGRARARARPGDRRAAGGDRAHGALHRALPLQGHEGAPGAVAREEARQDRAHRARPGRWGEPRVRLLDARALGAGDLRAAGRAASRWGRPARAG